jgi:26S proteasome regulatory subunit (ATPase 3-interacting protein)
MNKRTQQLRDETTSLNATAKSLRSSLSSLNSTLSTTDLRAAVANMETERTEILGRLTALRAGTMQPVSKEEKEEVDRQDIFWEKNVTKRRRIMKDMWSQILDSVPDAAQAAELKVSFLHSVDELCFVD